MKIAIIFSNKISAPAMILSVKSRPVVAGPIKFTVFFEEKCCELLILIMLWSNAFKNWLVTHQRPGPLSFFTSHPACFSALRYSSSVLFLHAISEIEALIIPFRCTSKQNELLRIRNCSSFYYPWIFTQVGIPVCVPTIECCKSS